MSIKKFDLDICFLSILYPPNCDAYDKQVKRHRGQNITSIQLDIIEGLKNNNATDPWIINTLLVPLFPKGFKCPFVKKTELKGPLQGVNHSFINCAFVHSSSLFYGAKIYLKRWARHDNNKTKVIIAYSLTSYTLSAMRFVKKVNPNIKTVIIVPDLPQFTYQNTNNPIIRFKNTLGRYNVLKAIQRNALSVDGWLLFSEKMLEKLPFCKKYMVFEGIATDLFKGISPKRLVDNTKIEILYAGGLNENYGLLLLLEAFSKIADPNYRLILAGRGNVENEIVSAAAEDSRIMFLGEIPRNELLALELGADLLVNPRVNSGHFTKYSFPSKNMEYLSSGTAMLGYKLDGIPGEYSAYISYFEKPTAENLAQTIMDLCSEKSDNATEKARLAKDFVSQNKSKDVWGYRILQFIESLN